MSVPAHVGYKVRESEQRSPSGHSRVFQVEAKVLYNRSQFRDTGVTGLLVGWDQALSVVNFVWEGGWVRRILPTSVRKQVRQGDEFFYVESQI